MDEFVVRLLDTFEIKGRKVVQAVIFLWLSCFGIGDEVSCDIKNSLLVVGSQSFGMSALTGKFLKWSIGD